MRYEIPLFQRPYVWDRDSQWAPLWEDVRQLAENVLAAGGGGPFGPQVAPHFLGAIVLDQQLVPGGFINVRHVIDGQQRLTTLQLLLDAAQWVAEREGATHDAQVLHQLVINQLAQHPDERFKVWPTDRDQAAFRAAMDNAVEVPQDLADSRIARAHAFFVDVIEEWADATTDPDARQSRLHALVQALHSHLRLVIIDLEPGDNAQVIFETLNHRGSPLLAADLIKNLVVQVARAQGHSPEDLYRTSWERLDNAYWRTVVSQGRLFRPRIDVFLNYWLTMKLRREVGTEHIFREFRDNVLRGSEDVVALVAELRADADRYESLETAAPSSVEGTFHYRVLETLGMRAVTPVVLQLLRWGPALPAAQKERALGAIESWLIRRAVCRATAQSVNVMMVELLNQLHGAEPDRAGDVVVEWLGSQTAPSRLWPDDDMIRHALTGAKVYGSIPQPRIRMLLEAIEDSYRSSFGEGQPCPRALSLEHVMPQKWRTYWSESLESTPDAALMRDRRVQGLGNLTLVTGKLNARLSNRPWRDADAAAAGLGDKGKVSHLRDNSDLKVNAKIVAANPDAWTDQAIDERERALIEQLLSIWPRPTVSVPLPESPEVAPEPLAPEDADAAGSADTLGKYDALTRFLARQSDDSLEMSFSDVESVLDATLPPSCRLSERHWRSYGGSAVARAIIAAGWVATRVRLGDETVLFIRDESNAVVNVEGEGV